MRDPRGVPGLDVRHARARATGDAPALLLDVRNPNEFFRVRADGAVLLPLHELPRRRGELPAGRSILVICATGNRSEIATAYLLATGHADVASVEGGTKAWLAAGLPVRSGAYAPDEVLGG